MSPQITRRQFVVGGGVSGAALLAACGRLPWQPQQPNTRLHRIGFLAASTRQPYHGALLRGLHDLGYVEGQNLVVEWRFTEGKLDGLREAATELVEMPVALIVVPAEPPARTIRGVSETMPVVMVRSLDPIGQGLIASLARPGGHTTGLTMMGLTLAQKRLELLKLTVPTLSRVAVLWDALNPVNAPALRETQQAAQILGVQLQPLEVRTASDFGQAFVAAVREDAEGMLVLAGPFIDTYRSEVTALTSRNNLPSISDEREWATEGGLMAYGPNLAAFYHRAAYFVDRILKGTKPADLPVEQPMTFDFVVNMKTARELGITFPREILLQVTEVIDQ
jgi:putative ABC transport system substrate-binding protein